MSYKDKLLYRDNKEIFIEFLALEISTDGSLILSEEIDLIMKTLYL